MCEKLLEVGKRVLKMGYYKNESVRSGKSTPAHEDAVANVLVEVGFIQVFAKRKKSGGDVFSEKR